MARVEAKVELLAHTPEPLALIYAAFRQCYHAGLVGLGGFVAGTDGGRGGPGPAGSLEIGAGIGPRQPGGARQFHLRPVRGVAGPDPSARAAPHRLVLAAKPALRGRLEFRLRAAPAVAAIPARNVWNTSWKKWRRARRDIEDPAEGTGRAAGRPLVLPGGRQHCGNHELPDLAQFFRTSLLRQGPVGNPPGGRGHAQAVPRRAAGTVRYGRGPLRTPGVLPRGRALHLRTLSPASSAGGASVAARKGAPRGMAASRAARCIRIAACVSGKAVYALSGV